ncbi:MAG: vWA domain-containing protein [Polyangia bacterium]
MNRKRVTYGLIGGTLCLAAWAATAMPHHTPAIPMNDPPTPVQRVAQQQVTVPKAPPRIEVVFALDTTGSMSGMLDGAKKKIWSVAQYIGNGQPKPELRIGLVAYRDRGDAYVTRFYDLTDDLDKVFDHLQSFEADGGGDGPEDVNRALADAIDKSSWTDGQNTLKMVYLVGDAPPHDDYHDAPDSKALARRAQGRGIRINAIRCGSDATTQLAFNRISQLASGEFASIDQGGGVETITTPYDDKLAALNAKLMGTAIGYGKSRDEVARKVARSLAAPAAMNADRASYFAKSGGGAVGGMGDLVKDIAEGRVKAEDVAPSDLPAAIAAMSPPARSAYVSHKAREREEVSTEINTLADERNAYLKKSKPKAGSLDGAVEGTLRRQAAAAGLSL